MVFVGSVPHFSIWSIATIRLDAALSFPASRSRSAATVWSRELRSAISMRNSLGPSSLSSGDQITSCGLKISLYAAEIERQKSHRVLERSLIIGGMVALWFFFILSVMTKLIALSN
jgi:hypothetical protein